MLSSKMLETVENCLLCHSRKSTFYTQAKSPFVSNTDLPKYFEVVKCSDCDFVYLKTRPTQEAIIKWYPDEVSYYVSNQKNSEVAPVRISKKFLDIGFGNCMSLQKKYEEGWDCYGVDISAHAVEQGLALNPNFRLKKGTLLKAKYPDNYFDLIALSHVLEHDYDPVSLLKEVFRILAVGGTVVIDIPNFGGLYYSLFGKDCEFFVPHHLSFFTRKTFSMAIKKAGFSKYKILNIFGNNTSYHLLHKLGLQKTYYKKTLFLNKVFGLFVYPMEIIFRKGDSMRVFLTKDS